MTEAATQTSPPERAAPTIPTFPREASLEPGELPGRKRTLLSELEGHLPLGVVGQDGKPHTALSCRVWTGRQEHAIDKLKRESKKTGEFPSKLLCYMFTQVGPHDFENMKEPEKRAILTQMYLGDVMYMYLWLRVQCIGGEMNMDLTCPNCGFEFPFRADLGSVEVRGAENVEAMKWRYELKHPFEIRKEKASALVLGPAKWATMEQTIKRAMKDGSPGSGAAKMTLIQNAVLEVEGRDPIALVENDLWDMAKVDIEQLSTLIDENEIGPDMSIKETCPRCEGNVHTSIDWGYDSFFGMSSRS